MNANAPNDVHFCSVSLKICSVLFSCNHHYGVPPPLPTVASCIYTTLSSIRGKITKGRANARTGFTGRLGLIGFGCGRRCGKSGGCSPNSKKTLSLNLDGRRIRLSSHLARNCLRNCSHFFQDRYARRRDCSWLSRRTSIG